MTDAPVALVLLAILSGCAVIMTFTVVRAAADVRRTLQGINALLPGASRATQEAARALAHVRKVLARTEHLSARVETLGLQACEAMGDAVRQFAAMKAQAEKSLGKWLGTNGHGTGAEPRSHHRRGR